MLKLIVLKKYVIYKIETLNSITELSNIILLQFYMRIKESIERLFDGQLVDQSYHVRIQTCQI